MPRQSNWREGLFHDLRQPIQAVECIVRLLKMENIEQDRGVISDLLAASIGEISELVAELSRSRKSFPDLPDFSFISIDEVLQTVVENCMPAAATAQIRLSKIDSSKRIISDRSMLVRALINLVHNSIKHSKGQVIVIGAEVCAENIELFVQDDGLGFLPRKRGAPGPGIGLVVVQEFCERTGSSVKFYSKNGSRVVLKIPGPWEHVEEKAKNHVVARKWIALVTTHPHTLKTFSKIFEPLGYLVADTTSGSSAAMPILFGDIEPTAVVVDQRISTDTAGEHWSQVRDVKSTAPRFYLIDGVQPLLSFASEEQTLRYPLKLADIQRIAKCGESKVAI